MIYLCIVNTSKNILLNMLFRSVHIVARFSNSTSTSVARFFYSPSLLRRGWSFRASFISRCCSSVCVRSDIDVARDSVVKIFSFSREPNVVQPWQTTEKEYSSSGFVISGRRILTNSHVAGDHPYVQVRKHGSSTKYKAEVKAHGYGCDLAILSINSEEFWEDMNPLELGDIPFIGETVYALGYPRGGDSISVTKGIVTRVEPQTYSHSSIGILTIQTDAAINDGNNGGPVVMDNKVAGVVYENRSSCDDYIIPTPIIKHFLTAVEETGQYIGLCSLDISYQSMENDYIRKHFKMSTEMTGVLINEINLLSSAQGILKKDDVILAIDGVPIGNDETIPFRKKERINFEHLVTIKKSGETVLLKVLRKGKEHEFNIIVRHDQPLVPDRHLPSYYILAGFVFVPLTKPYISKSCKICECSSNRKAKKAGEQIVIISQVLLNDITTGYRDFKDLQVKNVNGVEVLNLRHLSELIEKCCEEDLRLDLENGRVISLNYTSAKEATSWILEHHGIPSAMSKDLKIESSQLGSSEAALTTQ
ncbi:protease Do-like 4, mitochondrial isoform X2 [Arabidopsis lyrata subsp. lyrata]|nr:protease Do-like 4, mitochondrial isoform X2 [Arabidopsis lyrata subsp. lyrata]|eukprot:XP_002866059.2 protease Do-like 4, mitochondrial isoform X2 [Arabidopsis lyrata subsp. lyrata]